MLKKSLTVLAAGAICATGLVAGDKINGAGASFPAPLYYDWAYNYQKDTGNKINYQSIGSGGGIKQITKRIVNFGASDKPLKPKDLDKKKLFQFPAVIGSIVLAYNLDGVSNLKLKNSVVADIFLGKITNWNDAKIKADNPGVNLPNKKINVVHRSDGSGTTYNFTYYLSNVSNEWKTNVGTGKAVSWPTGLGGKGNEGVTNQIKQTPDSIGYIEAAYALKNNLPAATLQTKSGKWVEAKEENFKAAAAYAAWTKKDHFYQMLALQPGDKSYPIVAATFILLPREAGAMNAKVTAFYNHSFMKGDAAAKKLGYIALPQETKDMIADYWKMNKVSPK
jgi:phosphate transport system substrate-binding protein